MNNFEETIDYWQKEWNKVGDISQVLDTHKLLANIESDNEVMTRYYNLDGKLIYEDNNGINRKYLVFTETESHLNENKITIPQTSILMKIRRDLVCRKGCCFGNERGLAVATDGSFSQRIAEGNSDRITKEQWTPVLKELLDRNKVIAYLIHTHPVLFTDDGHIRGGNHHPSDIDSNTVFYDDNVGVIISWTGKTSDIVVGFSRKEEHYMPWISFYKKGETKCFYKPMVLSDFEKILSKIV